MTFLEKPSRYISRDSSCPNTQSLCLFCLVPLERQAGCVLIRLMVSIIICLQEGKAARFRNSVLDCPVQANALFRFVL